MTIELTITPAQIEEAKQLYEFEQLNDSITKGKGNLFGAVGEVVVKDYFPHAQIVGDYDFDIMIKGFKVDVKTKRANYPPQPDELCSVAAANIRQKCDYYFFVRVLENLKTAYLLGYLSKQDFYTKAAFNLKGETDKTSRHGWKFKADCFNIAIKDLHRFK